MFEVIQLFRPKFLLLKSVQLGKIPLAVIILTLGGCSHKETDAEICVANESSTAAVIESCSRVLANPETQSMQRENALINRGWAYVSDDRPSLGLADFNTVVRFNPSRAPGHSGRASVLYSLGKIEEAAKEMDIVLELAPHARYLGNSHFERGTFRFLLGQNLQAIEDFNDSMQFDPSYSASYEWRGSARFSDRDYGGAKQDFLQAATQQPGDPEPILMWYISARLDGDRLALEDLRRASKEMHDKEWPTPVIDMMLGKVSPIELRNLQSVNDNEGRQICDFDFYAAEYYRISEDTSQADQYFRIAAQVCPAKDPFRVLARSQSKNGVQQ